MNILDELELLSYYIIRRDTLADIFDLKAEATEPLYKIKKKTLIDLADEVRAKECSTAKIPVPELGKRRRLATAIPYNEANEGDKLYEANFESGTYNKDKSGSIWKIGINSGATVAEDTALIVDGTKYQDHIYVDQRYIGTLPLYTLENKTYTLEFDFFKEASVYRHRVFFANGVFIDSETGGNMNGSRCDTNMYCLGFQIQNNKTTGKISYQFADNGANFTSTNLIQPNNTIWEVDENGERSAKLKVVLKCGAKKENITIYNGNGTIQKDGVSTWTGDIIPIYFTVYCDDSKAAEGLIYQPADVPLVFGIGSYEKPTESQYYGLRDLNIYKGDMVDADISFTIDGIEYTVPEGTPWEIFIDNNSDIGLSYKSYEDGAEVHGGKFDYYLALGEDNVKKGDLIEDGGEYVSIQGIPFSVDGKGYEVLAETKWSTFVNANSDRGFSVKNGFVYLNGEQIFQDNVDQFVEVRASNTIIEFGEYTTAVSQYLHTIIFKNVEQYNPNTSETIRTGTLQFAKIDYNSFVVAVYESDNGTMTVDGWTAIYNGRTYTVTARAQEPGGYILSNDTATIFVLVATEWNEDDDIYTGGEGTEVVTEYSGETDMLTFTYKNIIFECPASYTWREFAESPYNTDGMFTFDTTADRPYGVLNKDGYGIFYADGTQAIETDLVSEWAYNQGGDGSVITFTVGGVEYVVTKGTTWRDWIKNGDGASANITIVDGRVCDYVMPLAYDGYDPELGVMEDDPILAIEYVNDENFIAFNIDGIDFAAPNGSTWATFCGTCWDTSNGRLQVDVAANSVTWDEWSNINDNGTVQYPYTEIIATTYFI